MTIAELERAYEQISEIIDRCEEEPLAWILAANPVWGRAESINVVAIFDTREEATEYERASRLKPDDDKFYIRTDDGIIRKYRSDSLLYDYNPAGPLWQTSDGVESMLVPARPAPDIGSIVQNPLPPTGECPVLTNLRKPRYGKDYDQGFGPPPGGYIDTDGVKPTLEEVEARKNKFKCT